MLLHKQTHTVIHSVYLIRFEHSSHHLASGEHVHPDVDVSLAAFGPAVPPHPLQVLLCPVVVGEDSVASIEKHPVTDTLR